MQRQGTEYPNEWLWLQPTIPHIQRRQDERNPNGILNLFSTAACIKRSDYSATFGHLSRTPRHYLRQPGSAPCRFSVTSAFLFKNLRSLPFTRERGKS